MVISKEEYYGVAEYNDDDIVIDLSTYDACGESLVYTADTSSIATAIADSTIYNNITASTITLDSYANNDITIQHDGKDIKVAESISDLTVQIEVLTEILHEMIAASNYDIKDFNMARRIEQRRMVKRLAGE